GYAGGMTGNAACFSGSPGCVLSLSGTACPNLAAMPEWTVAFWYNLQSAPPPGTGLFVIMDGTANQLGFYTRNQNQNTDLALQAPNNWNDYSNNGPTGLSDTSMGAGHWTFVLARKRAFDGAIAIMQSSPA